MPSKLSFQDIYMFVKENSDCELVSTEYTNRNLPLKFKCLRCGKEFEMLLDNFKVRVKKKLLVCAKCIDYDKNIETIFQYVKNNGNCIFVNKNYSDVMSNDLTFICGDCGKEFSCVWTTFKAKTKKCCYDCYCKNKESATKLSYEEVKSRIETNSQSKLISTEYVNCKEKLMLRCQCNTNFEVSLTNFEKGKIMCDECSGRGIQWDYESIKEYMREKGCELISKVYKDCDHKLSVKCKECGCDNTVSWYDFYKNKKYTCNKCSHARIGIASKHSYEYVSDYAKKYSCELISKNYSDVIKDIDFKCKCGEIFTTTFAKFRVMKTKQCKTCYSKQCSDKQGYSFEEVKKYIDEDSNSGCSLLSTEYKLMNKTNLLITCKCGETFKTTYSSFRFKNKQACDMCTCGRVRWDIDKVRKFVKENSKCELYSTEFTTVDDDMEFICACGNHFITNFDRFKSKRDKKQCNECSDRSRLEKRTREFLKLVGIKYVSEKKFKDCINPKTNYKLRYDFYLPEYNILLELDGIQHEKPIRFHHAITEEEAVMKFKEQVYKDRIKNEYAISKNIPLIRINYWEIEFIEVILIKELKLQDIELKNIIYNRKRVI